VVKKIVRKAKHTGDNHHGSPNIEIGAYHPETAAIEMPAETPTPVENQNPVETSHPEMALQVLHSFYICRE
jgi:hypothetical protein